MPVDGTGAEILDASWTQVARSLLGDEALAS
jgi:hypothetical protein